MITEIFGENCKIAKVFDLLLSHPNTEYTKKDIAECADIARPTLDNFIDKLIRYQIVEITKKVGNGKYYKINMKSSITQALNSFQNQLADIEIEKEMRRYQKEVDPTIKPIKPFEEIIKKEIKKEPLGFRDYLDSINEKAKEPIQRLSKGTRKPTSLMDLGNSSENSMAILSCQSTQKEECINIYNN